MKEESCFCCTHLEGKKFKNYKFDMTFNEDGRHFYICKECSKNIKEGREVEGKEVLRKCDNNDKNYNPLFTKSID